ncbi:MAG: SDR family oxidoreductase [Alphaproteobacteria bacterium]|nr:SDR family oxidoreductase [Alphaproteobacteria bacterium]
MSSTKPKTAIVTGAARGIGRSCALELAARGYDIALVDLLEPEMKRTAGEIEALGRRVLAYTADVTAFGRAHDIAGDVAGRWGTIGFLLNNAGASNPKGILDIKEEEFDRTIAVNLKSCFNYVHAVAPIMLKQETGGRIASMSSLNALSGGVTSAVSKHSYAAAKAGILGLTRSLAKELGPKIMINAICPGVIETELASGLTKSRGPELMKGIALDRLGKPADVAQLVAFLATAEPCFITGQHFVIDGFQWSC